MDAAPADARKGTWVQTFTGRAFWPLDPRPEELFIEDIAHALSHVCRYGGHVRRFYSVAQHSVLAAQAAPPEFALEALLHDASEAYIGDMVSPLKRMIPAFQEIEDGIMRAVAQRYGIPASMSPEVKAIDTALLADEVHALMADPPAMWSTPLTGLGIEIRPWEPRQARAEFLSAFFRLIAA